MKRILLTLCIVFSASVSMIAQEKMMCVEKVCDVHNNRSEWFMQMKAKKLVFLVKEMGLTDTEEAAFAVLFEKHETEMGECYKKMRVAKKSLNEESTEEDYKKAVEVVRVETLKKEKIRAEYLEKIEKIMPASKIYKLYEAEEQYKKLLIRDMGKCKKVEEK